MPVCPTTNNLFRGRRYKTDAYKAWQVGAGWAVKVQRPGQVAGRVGVRIEAPFGRNRDLDNIKAALDLIVSVGIIKNDNLIDDLRIVRVAKGDEMTISIWPMEAPCPPPLP